MNCLSEAEVFVIVVEEGSFTAAAQRLDVTKSYASKLVAKLEDRLGVRLLQRSTRKLSLTEQGRVYYERSSEVMRLLKEAESEVAQLQTTPRGLLRITLPAALGVNYLTGAIVEFKKRYPQLAVETFFSDRQVDLLEEGFDLAIRAGDLPDTSLVAQRLATVERIVCTSSTYLTRRGTPNEPEELAQHECLRYTHNPSPGTWKLHGPRGEIAVEVSGSLLTNNARMLVEAAGHGLGLIFVPVFHVAPLLRTGQLRRVLPAWRAFTPIHVMFPAVRHLSLKVRLFVDFVVERFRSPLWDQEERWAPAPLPGRPLDGDPTPPHGRSSP